MEVGITRPFTKNFHAQFSLPHFMTRLDRSGYQLTFWAKLHRATGADVVTEIVFLDVDEGYEWIGGAEVSLMSEWQHIAMEPVYTKPAQKGHEIQIAFLLGLKQVSAPCARVLWEPVQRALVSTECEVSSRE